MSKYLTLDGLKTYNDKLNNKLDTRVDDRTVWVSVDELIKRENWTIEGETYLKSYNGLVAYIEDLQQVWVLVDKSKFDGLLTNVGFGSIEDKSPSALGWKILDSSTGNEGNLDVFVEGTVLRVIK